MSQYYIWGLHNNSFLFLSQLMPSLFFYTSNRLWPQWSTERCCLTKCLHLKLFTNDVTILLKVTQSRVKLSYFTVNYSKMEKSHESSVFRMWPWSKTEVLVICSLSVHICQYKIFCLINHKVTVDYSQLIRKIISRAETQTTGVRRLFHTCF